MTLFEYLDKHPDVWGWLFLIVFVMMVFAEDCIKAWRRK